MISRAHCLIPTEAMIEKYSAIAYRIRRLQALVDLRTWKLKDSAVLESSYVSWLATRRGAFFNGRCGCSSFGALLSKALCAMGSLGSLNFEDGLSFSITKHKCRIGLHPHPCCLTCAARYGCDRSMRYRVTLFIVFEGNRQISLEEKLDF